MTPGSLTKQAQDNPDAELYVHPECGCATSALYLTGTGAVPADRVKILSTDGMLDAARASMSKQVLVATEVGMLHQLRRAAPEVDFRAVNERASCRYIEDAALSLVSHAVLAAAGSRTESRGCHVRTDHPHTDDVRQRVSLMVDLDPRGRPTVRPANVARHQAA